MEQSEKELIPNIKIVLDPVYDYLASLKRIVSEDKLNKLLTEYESQLELQLSSWVAEARELLTSSEQRQLDFFFSPDTNLGLGLNLLVKELDGKTSIIDFINHLKDTSQDEIVYYLLQDIYVGKKELTTERIREFINFEGNSYDLIEENFKVSDKGKWKVLKILSKPQEIQKYLITFLENYYAKIYSDEEKKRNRFLTNYLKDNEIELKEACRKGLTEILSLEEGMIDYNKTVTVAITYFGEFSDVGYFEKNLFVVGYRYPKYIEEVVPTIEDLSEQEYLFKALADKTRLKMLLELNKGSKYSTELAEQLNISTATVNYHINKFLNAGVIKIDKAENRIYYKLKRNRLKELIFQLESSFNLQDE